MVMANAKRKPTTDVALAITQRSITLRIFEITATLREPSTPSDEVLCLMEEFAALCWQLGFPICAPDPEIQEELAKRGWLLHEYFDPFPDEEI